MTFDEIMDELRAETDRIRAEYGQAVASLPKTSDDLDAALLEYLDAHDERIAWIRRHPEPSRPGSPEAEEWSVHCHRSIAAEDALFAVARAIRARRQEQARAA